MTDDLVKRLREGACLHNQLEAYGLTTEAADRIEILEEALRLIADTDPAGDQYWPGRIARTALGENNP
jgi:hypothetical protein